MNQAPNDFNRREFLKGGSLATLMTMLGGVELIAQTNKVAEELSSTAKVRVAVIGLGTWGREILKTLAREPQAEVAAICHTYAASVRLQVYTQTSTGAWKESDRATVGDVDGWFWYPLTGKGAVCQFSTSAGEPAPVDVSLLVTPSIGCSQPSHFVVEQGRIHAG